MAYVHRTLIVTAANAPRARSLCEQLAGPPGSGMFTRALSSSESGEPSHFISAGKIEDTFADVLADPSVMFNVCSQAGITVTEQECVDLLAQSDITDEAAYVAIGRLGLSFIQEDI